MIGTRKFTSYDIGLEDLISSDDLQQNASGENSDYLATIHADYPTNIHDYHNPTHVPVGNTLVDFGVISYGFLTRCYTSRMNHDYFKCWNDSKHMFLFNVDVETVAHTYC